MIETTTSQPSYISCVGMGWFPQSPGGLNRYVYELLQALSHDSLADGGSVEYCGIDIPENRSNPNLLLTNLATDSSLLPQRLLSVFNRFSKRSIHQPDAINLHFSLYSMPILAQLPKHVPVTFTFHGPWAAESAQEGDSKLSVFLKRSVEHQVFRRCDRFITLSRAFADILHSDYGIPYSKIYTIPGGIDTATFQNNLTRQAARDYLHFPQQRPILFSPRRLVQRVGLDKLLEALILVKQYVPDVWLAVAGKGPQREALEQKTKTLGLSNNVKFLGYVSDKDLPICYQAADLTVVPSQALEGFGLILLESLASGTPVLSTPVGGMPEVLCPLDKNLVTHTITPVAIGDRLIQCLTGKLSLPSREKCRAYAVRNYDWNIIAPRVKDILLMPS